VFAGLFALLALVAFLAARATRRAVPATGDRAVSVVTWIIPFASLVTAAIVPLAAGLYLLTTTAWTLAERTVLRRRFLAATGPAQPAAAAPPAPATPTPSATPPPAARPASR
jgi:YidC/Oxa1 family membrane protein insertase